ncbi:MAG TPA: lytic transglycosylase domain-containing protein, partial [Methylobacterium sp.]
MIKLRTLVLAAAFASAGSSALAVGETETVEQALCRLIEGSAKARGLPVPFLTRLIWRESSFRAGAVSPAGAQGIAQFMPGTARERGLSDPFDPEQAIPHAAHLLADLNRRFGNLGLAAAAYNGGPGRVSAWLAGTGGLPAETRAYVIGITGAPAEDWRGGTDAAVSAPETA